MQVYCLKGKPPSSVAFASGAVFGAVWIVSNRAGHICSWGPRMAKRRSKRRKQSLPVEPTTELPFARLRITDLLDERGMTMRELAERSGLSESLLSRMARQEKGYSRESLHAIAKALGVDVPQLFEASWQDVPVFGIVEDGGHVRPVANGTVHAPTVRAPAVYGDLLALVVSGSAMAPRYMDKETILCAKAPASPDECIGKECVVQIDNGQTMIRFVHKGSAPDKYVLTSHNQAPIVDASIIISRPIIKP